MWEPLAREWRVGQLSLWQVSQKRSHVSQAVCGRNPSLPACYPVGGALHATHIEERSGDASLFIGMRHGTSTRLHHASRVQDVEYLWFTERAFPSIDTGSVGPSRGGMPLQIARLAEGEQRFSTAMKIQIKRSSQDASACAPVQTNGIPISWKHPHR